MMLVHFKETFPFRVAEWFLTICLMSWGMVLINPAFVPAQHILGGTVFTFIDPALLALGCLIVGLFRFAALTINGLWWRTPSIRLAMAFLSNFFWVLIVLGVVASGRVSTGLAIYPWFVVLELYNSFRAAHDARLAWSAVKGSASGARRSR